MKIIDTPTQKTAFIRLPNGHKMPSEMVKNSVEGHLRSLFEKDKSSPEFDNISMEVNERKDENGFYYHVIGTIELKAN